MAVTLRLIRLSLTLTSTEPFASTHDRNILSYESRPYGAQRLLVCMNKSRLDSTRARVVPTTMLPRVFYTTGEGETTRARPGAQVNQVLT